MTVPSSVRQGALAIAIGLGALAAVWYLARPLAILLLGITLAEALAPIVDALGRWIPRRAAIIAIYLAIVAVLVLVGWLIVPTLVAETQTLIAALPGAMQEAQRWIQRWIPSEAGQVTNSASSALSAVAVQAVALSTRAISGVLTGLLVVFFSIYWLMEQPAIRRFALSLASPGERSRTADVLSEMGLAIGGYVRGVVADGAIMAALAWVGMFAIGLDYALTLAALTFLGELVPYFGPFIVGLAAVAVGLGQSSTKAILAGVVYAALQELEGHIVTPIVMQSQTNLPPTMVLFAVCAGTVVGGALGLIVAIPLAAVARVLFLRLVVPAVQNHG